MMAGGATISKSALSSLPLSFFDTPNAFAASITFWSDTNESWSCIPNKVIVVQSAHEIYWQ